METYRTEEEQVEAIRRWWDENGRSTIVAIVLALAAGFGWQAWKDYDRERTENASYVYQAMLQSLNDSAAGEKAFPEAKSLAEQLKNDYTSTTYAQFAALHLAKLAVGNNDLEEAKTQLLWVLSKAPAKSDIAGVTQLRLARVLASSGETDQALDILAKGQEGDYAASYAIAQGDIYMQQDRLDDANRAYARANMSLLQNGVGGRVPTLDQKVLSLNPVPARAMKSDDEANDPGVEELLEAQEG